MTPEYIRELRIQRRAKEFAKMVKESGMAHFISDEIIDFLETDKELKEFQYLCVRLGLILRSDNRWEKP